MTEGAIVQAAPVERAGTDIAWRLTPLLVALGSLAIGAIALGNRPIASLEARSIARAEGSFGELLTAIEGAPAQAGHLVALHLAMIGGDDEIWLRLPSVVAIALGAGLLVGLGSMLLGRIGGLAAGIALAANAGVVAASREARPYALGILGIVAATLLLVVALERGGRWRWGAYALMAAALPLFHPLAASVLAAHGAALIARRDRGGGRTAGIALVTGVSVSALLLAWMAADRFDSSELGALDLESLGRSLAAASGWNPALALAAAGGIAFLFHAAHPLAPERWISVLIVSLIAAPIVVTLLAAVALPVRTGALVLSAPGVALAVGAVALLLSTPRGLVVAGLAVLLVASAATISGRLLQPVDEDWRALATAVERARGPAETVVVVPEGSREAFSYYAPFLRTIRFARGDGAWVAVRAGSSELAIEASRPVVATPRYALLRQVRFGEGLWLQHWVRP